MKLINAEQQVTVTIYDEEHEEHLVKTMTVEEMLDTYANEGCPTIYSNPERKNGKWIKEHWHSDHVRQCSACHVTQTVTTYRGVVNFKFCPYCGADMRGDE